MSSNNWVVFSHSADLGGAELSLIPFIDAALDAGVSVTVVLPKPGPLSQVLEKKQSVSIEYRPTQKWMTGKLAKLSGLIRLAMIWVQSLQISSWLSKNSFSRVVVNTSVIPAPLYAAKRVKIQSLVFVHELIKSNPDLRSLLPKKLIISELNRLAAWVVVPSKVASKELGNHSIVIPPRLSVPIKPKKSLERIHMNGPGSPIRIVMLGRIHESKGAFEAIEVVEGARKRGVVVQLTFYGASDRITQERITARLDSSAVKHSVRFLSPQIDIDSIFENADLTFALSKVESYGRVVRESVARSVPVIASNIPVYRDVLNNGQGVLVQSSFDEIPPVLEAISKNPEIYRQMVRQCGEVPRDSNYGADDLQLLIDRLQA